MRYFKPDFIDNLISKFTNLTTTQMLIVFIVFVGIVYIIHTIIDCEDFKDEEE